MFIPQGDWIVVIRKVRGESSSRGKIIKAHLTERQARAHAQDFKSGRLTDKFNCWAMHKDEY